jgi:copper oxidase (laccase) domain-containing protein
MKLIRFSSANNAGVPLVFEKATRPSTLVLWDGVERDLAEAFTGHVFPLAENAFHVRFGLDEMLPGACEIEQIHSSTVLEEASVGPGATGDGLFAVRGANDVSRILGVRTADCLAVAFAAQIENVRYGALVHAGWRGYTQGIHLNAINQLASAAEVRGVSRKRFFDSVDVLVAPAIWGASYECGSDVGEAIAAHHEKFWMGHSCWTQWQPVVKVCANVATSELPRIDANSYQCGKVYPDLQLLMACDCAMAGVSLPRIQVVRENTWGSPILFSYRQANLGGRVEGRRLHTHLVFAGVA